MLDFRLLPAFAAAWSTAGIGLLASGALGWQGLVVLAGVFAAGAGIAAALSLAVAAPARPGVEVGTGVRGGIGDGAGRRAQQGRTGRRAMVGYRVWLLRIPPAGFAQVVACLGVAAAVAGSVGVQLREREIGGLADLVAARTAVVIHGAVVGTPKPAGPGKAWEASVTVRATALEAHGEIRTVRSQFVLLGEVGGLQREESVVVRGSLAKLPPTSRAAALLLDAEVVSTAAPTGWGSGIARARERFLEITEGLSAQGRALVPGIAVGDDSRLDDTLEAAMRRTSLSHLTAVSGSHVTILLVALALVLGKFARPVRVLMALVGLVALVILVGAQPSVLRAAAMGTVGIVALARGRPPHALPAWAGGITVALVIDPWLAVQFGFALSAAAAAAILLLTRPLADALVGAEATGRKRSLAMVLAVPLAAGLACAPIMVLLAPEVSLVGVVTNALAMLAVAPATVLGLIGVLLATPLPGVALVVARGAEVFTWWIATVALQGAHLPLASFPWPTGLGGAALAAVAGAAVIVAIMQLPRLRSFLSARRASRVGVGASPAEIGRSAHARASALGLVGVLVVAVNFHLFAQLKPPAWDVWHCDVGQGAAMLVASGPGRAVMVDVGEPDGRSQDCLVRAGVRKLDLLVLTHPHADHVGNLPAILAAVRVERILVAPSPIPAATVAWVTREAAAVGLTPEQGSAGMAGTAGDSRWQVLWPPSSSGLNDVNELSVVVFLQTASGISALALGDLGSQGQDGLVRMMRAAGVSQLDVLGVAHHGSRDQSATLAELTRPAVAVFSVGENNYGHPTEEALGLYANVGAQVKRTDQLGDVIVVGGQR